MADARAQTRPLAPPAPAMRRRILDAAADLLAENGYQATTLRGIAEAAGLKAASIYHHFQSKEQITVEILNEGVIHVSTAVSDAVEPLTQTATGKEILAAAINAHLEALWQHQAYTRASIRCFSAVPEDIRKQTVESRRAFDTVWLDVLRSVQASGALAKNTDMKSLHLVILGALNWTIEWRTAGTQEKQALAQTLLQLVFPAA